MRHFIEDMTNDDLLGILLSPFTTADYKLAALNEKNKRADKSKAND